jgi:hypothetical protein
MRSTSFAASLLLLLLTSLTYSQTSGRVTGTVLNEFSQPIDKAQVCSVVFRVINSSKSQSDASCFVRTDKTGQFEIDHLPMGTYSIAASKNDDGYAEFGQGTPYPKVILTPEEPLANVIVKLGPKQGILIPVVKDKVTGKRLFDFDFNWQTVVPGGSSTGAGRFNQLTSRTPIPAGKDVSLEISANGYKDSSQVLRLRSGEQKTLTIELQPEAKNTFITH